MLTIIFHSNHWEVENGLQLSQIDLVPADVLSAFRLVPSDHEHNVYAFYSIVKQIAYAIKTSTARSECRFACGLTNDMDCPHPGGTANGAMMVGANRPITHREEQSHEHYLRWHRSGKAFLQRARR